MMMMMMMNNGVNGKPEVDQYFWSIPSRSFGFVLDSVTVAYREARALNVQSHFRSPPHIDVTSLPSAHHYIVIIIQPVSTAVNHAHIAS